MKHLILFVAVVLIALSCKKDDDTNSGNVNDTTPPVITISTSNPDTIPLFAEIVEIPTVTATDNVDGTVTVNSDWSSTNPDINVEAGYTINYTASDQAGNTAHATLTVIVKDNSGPGGNVSIIAFPQHHGVPVISQVTHPDSAFIKYNAQLFPGYNLSDYDTFVVANAGEDHISLLNMKAGMTGFDTAISERVSGGIPVTVQQHSGQQNILVPVTE
jgi:hypothetical protein